MSSALLGLTKGLLGVAFGSLRKVFGKKIKISEAYVLSLRSQGSCGVQVKLIVYGE
jgi:hypothetical protein